MVYYKRSWMDVFLVYLIHFRSAFLIMMGVTLDDLDGRQARRTGTSSVLGEWLDHTCDSFSCFLILSQFLSIVGIHFNSLFLHSGYLD